MTSYRKRGKEGRAKKIWNREFNQLMNKLGTVKCSLFPNMKKLRQKLRDGEPVYIDASVGKYEWSVPTNKYGPDYYPDENWHEPL